MKTHSAGFGQRLTLGDSLPWLRGMRPASADLVFADPPFNIGWKYAGYNDRRTPADYLGWCRGWIDAAVQTLYAGGAFWLAIGDEYAAELAVECKAAGLVMRNWCVWFYRFGNHLESKFGRNKTHLMYFTRGPGKPAYWNPPREQSERQRIGDKRANPRGRVPGDVWEFSRVCGNFKERTDHPCQMPVAILDRVLLSTCPPSGLALDPFAGSGVTIAAAKRTGRFAHGCEQSPQYVRLALKRLTGKG